jgi:hypothetical protein
MAYYGDQLPRLSHYAEAKAWYETRQPYKRGRSKGLRPLGDNRKYDRSLISLDTNSEGQNIVVCKYHSTPVVTFCEDGSVVLTHDGFETVSTMDFINAILYTRFRVPHDTKFTNVHTAQKWAGITRRRGKLYFSDGYDKDHRFESVLKLSPTNEVTGTATEFAWTLNKERMTKVRKHYAEFAEYLTYYAQMTGESRIASQIPNSVALLATTISELRWNESRCIRAISEFFDSLHEGMALSGEDRFAMFLPLADQVVVNASMKTYDYNMRQYMYMVTPQRARDHFYDLCRFHYAWSLFTREVVPQGKIVLDDSAKYLKYSSNDVVLPFSL